jgi:2-amino-4-hydroxy-6-hydroxymethyldihydropteridine diphosphokinase
MTEVVLALGSNLGNSRGYMIAALGHLNRLGYLKKVASLYQTSPYGFYDQPDFLNTAVIAETKLKPFSLLRELKKIEHEMGRTTHQRWGPREIDLDIIFYDQKVISSEKLTIPHPDFHNRAFVLLPLAEIAPDWISPVHKSSVRDLLRTCKDQTTIKLLEKNWYSDVS